VSHQGSCNGKRGEDVKNVAALLVIWMVCFTGCGIFNPTLPSGKVPEPKGHDKFITLNDIRYHYLHYPGSGTPVVLLHGFASSTYTWEAMAPILNGKGYPVRALDMKGFGWSDKPLDSRYDVVALMEDVNRWMEALGLSSTVFVGNSLGGAIAVLLSERYPQRIDKMVLIDAGGYPMEPPAVIKMAHWPLAHWGGKMIFGPWMVRRNLKQVMHDPNKVTQERVAAYYDRMCTQNALATQIKTARAIDFSKENPVPAAARGNTTDTLIIWGETDRWIPLEIGHRFKKEMSNAVLHVIPECGHIPQEEKPEETARLILDFIEGRPIAAKQF
jgi:pimeloyl-ACP methyl ester carboxylesterase